METENGSALTVTFYISKNSFVNQCYEEKTIFSVQQCDFHFFHCYALNLLYTLKHEKKYGRF